MTTVPAVRVRDLRYRYRGGERDILRIGALDIDGPGLLAVTGPTGVGKTTLMELIAGTLREPYHGSIRVLGVELRDLRRDRDRQCHLRRIGLIPQDFGLLAGCTVADILHRDLADAQVPLEEHTARVARALDQVGLGAFAGRMSEQLSGGQRQRVAIARTLARDVELIIADEPTANLDPAQADSIIDLFERLSAGRPVAVVTHDPRVAARCARHLELRPLVQAPPPAAAVVAGARAGAATGPRRAAALAGTFVLAVAVAGSTLAVRATNAHRTAHHGAAVALRLPGAGPRPGRVITAAPSRPGAPAAAPAPHAPAPPIGPEDVITRIVPVVQVVDRTSPGAPPTDPSSPLPVPVASPPTAPPLPTSPPAPAPPAPAPPAPAPYFAIAGHDYPVCSGTGCSSSFVHDADWTPNVPSYADADGSIIGNAHGLPTGLEVDYWNGSSLARLQVLASTTVLNWGRPGPTGPPPGTVMEVGGVDQGNACMDPTCAAPYYYTYVYLGPATSAAG